VNETSEGPDRTVRCPDCGAPNPADGTLCFECQHPLVAPEASAVMPRGERPQRPGRVAPTVATLGYRPERDAGTNPPGWLWAIVGLVALVAVLVAAIQIANQAPPLVIPNATKPQLAQAESLASVLKKDSTSAEANVALGNLYYDTGNFGAAIPHYRTALRSDPSLTDVRVDMGVAYHNTDDVESARKTLEDAVAHSPDHAIAHFDLGVVYQTLGKKEEARAQYLKAKSLDHPPEMSMVVDQLLERLDHPDAPTGSGLPPGHPDVGGASGAGLPPGHPDVTGGAAPSGK
jgi:predicted negative regulator of RcsB-dependent stress response